MILSTNFLKDYVDIDVDLKTLAEDMTKAGNEYDSAENLINATKLVIGEIKECEMHPDSDHLHVCKVDVGNEIIQIVCGAPNARAGIKVIVALPGAELPEKSIKAGEIRGVKSNGMMCSIAELGLDNKFLTEADKAGIAELNDDAPVGGDPIKYLQMDDGVIDFDLTANRGDLLSVIGMAYEIGAIYDKKVKLPSIEHKENNENINNTFNVKVETENCSVYLAKCVKNVVIKESPTFIKNRLIASGIRPINNVVDISNYVMLETGQPLHFFDRDKLTDTILVRMAKDGEHMNTLDGQDRKLSSEDIVITNGTEPIALAGVMGGLETEITDSTKNILIEAAIFDSVKVRRTSNNILRSESSNRFEKGLDSKRTYMAAERACTLLEQYADGEVVGGTCTYDVSKSQDKVIDITVENITNLLGLDIPKADIVKCFDRLGFTTKESGNKLTVTVPSRRIDIEIKEDLIEEVGRIYGVDNIVGKLPDIKPKAGSYDKVSRQIRNKLVDLGLNETLTYVLVSENDSKMFTRNDDEKIKLLAPLAEDRNTLRQSLAISLYRTYEYNKAHYNKDVNLFEIAKVFSKSGDDYKEANHVGILMTGSYMQGFKNTMNTDFYVIKGVAEELLDYLGYGNRYSFVVDKEKLSKELHPGQSALISVNNDIVGCIGKVHPKLEKEAVYVMEIDLDRLLEKKVGKMKYKEISKFPSVKKDLALVVDKNKTSLEVAGEIKRAGGNILQKVDVFDVYDKGLEPHKVSIAYNLTFESSKETLTDEQVNEAMEKIIAALDKKGIKLRG